MEVFEATAATVDRARPRMPFAFLFDIIIITIFTLITTILYRTLFTDDMIIYDNMIILLYG